MLIPGEFVGTAETIWDGLSLNEERGSRHVDQGPNCEDWDRFIGEMIATQTVVADHETRISAVEDVVGDASGAGTEGTDVEAEELAGAFPIHQTTISFDDLSITMTDAGAAGSHGTHTIYTFPQGNIAILGCVSDLQIARVGTALTATSAVVGAVGTVATVNDNATLTSTEADIMPSTSATLSSGAGNCDGESTLTELAVHNGTASAIVARLNFATPDAGSTGNDALLVNGTVKLTWVNLGDN